MYDAVADDYCYPNSTVLKNKLDLTDADELEAFEAEVSDARADEELPAGDLDFPHFKAVHRHLFQDVYDWAGEIRTVRMSKGGKRTSISSKGALSFVLMRSCPECCDSKKSAETTAS